MNSSLSYNYISNNFSIKNHSLVQEDSNNLRVLLTITHILLVVVGCVNIYVIITIIRKSLIYSITNVYIISLCLADFIYLLNLLFVVLTQLNKRSWPFGVAFCNIYHGAESLSKNFKKSSYSKNYF